MQGSVTTKKSRKERIQGSCNREDNGVLQKLGPTPPAKRRYAMFLCPIYVTLDELPVQSQSQMTTNWSKRFSYQNLVQFVFTNIWFMIRAVWKHFSPCTQTWGGNHATCRLAWNKLSRIQEVAFAVKHVCYWTDLLSVEMFWSRSQSTGWHSFAIPGMFQRSKTQKSSENGVATTLRVPSSDSENVWQKLKPLDSWPMCETPWTLIHHSSLLAVNTSPFKTAKLFLTQFRASTRQSVHINNSQSPVTFYHLWSYRSPSKRKFVRVKNIEVRLGGFCWYLYCTNHPIPGPIWSESPGQFVITYWFARKTSGLWEIAVEFRLFLNMSIEKWNPDFKIGKLLVSCPMFAWEKVGGARHPLCGKKEPFHCFQPFNQPGKF